MAFATDQDIVEQIAVIQREPGTFNLVKRKSALKAAHNRIVAMLKRHYVVESTTDTNVTNPDGFLIDTEAKLAAAVCIRRQYAVTNREAPQYVVRAMMECLRDIKNACLSENNRQQLSFGLTPLGEPSETDALAKGVMDDKRASIDRSDAAWWWDPADDGTTDADGVLGDEGIYT